MTKLLTYCCVCLLAAGLLTACGKDLGDCFTSAGPQETEYRQAEAFNSILLKDNVDVELMPSASNKMEVTAGKNLMGKIVTKVVNGRLEIGNDNDCNWVRSYSHPLKVKVYAKQIDSIEYRSSGNLTFLDTLRCDTFLINVYEGGGNIKLLLHVEKSQLNSHLGTADLRAYGFSQVNYIYQASFGPVIADSLVTNFNYLENKGTNNCFVQANIALGVTISGPGNVYYSGKADVNLVKTGSGQLIKITP